MLLTRTRLAALRWVPGVGWPQGTPDPIRAQMPEEYGDRVADVSQTLGALEIEWPGEEGVSASPSPNVRLARLRGTLRGTRRATDAWRERTHASARSP